MLRVSTKTAKTAVTLVQKRPYIKAGYDLAKKIMPKISATEAAALNAGTVGFDGDLFAGSASLKKLLTKYDVKLSAEEQAFMDGPVTQLCDMINDYQVLRDRDLPENVWQFIKEKGFFGMIIPKAYGGLGFTAHGHSQVVTKLASRSG